MLSGAPPAPPAAKEATFSSVDNAHTSSYVPPDVAVFVPANTTLDDIRSVASRAATDASEAFKPFAASSAQRSDVAENAPIERRGKSFCHIGNHALKVGTKLVRCVMCRSNACREHWGSLSDAHVDAIADDETMAWICVECSRARLEDDVDDVGLWH